MPDDQIVAGTCRAQKFDGVDVAGIQHHPGGSGNGVYHRIQQQYPGENGRAGKMTGEGRVICRNSPVRGAVHEDGRSL